MKKRKALFFDIDGTIISEQTNDYPGGIPDSTRQAIQQVNAKGHLTFINTGRTQVFLPEELKQLLFTGYLCGCGTRIECEGKELLHQEIKEDELRKIIHGIRESHMEGVLEGTDAIYYQSDIITTPTLKMMYELHRETKSHICMSWDLPNMSVDKFVVFAREQSQPEHLFKLLRSDFEIMDRLNSFYEIVPKGYSKATAIEFVLQHYGIEKSDAYVFGDSSNDLSMFQCVPNAIAMKEHDPVLDPYSSFVTKSVEEDGIAFAMKEIGVI